MNHSGDPFNASGASRWGSEPQTVLPAIPEPMSLALLAGAVAGLGRLRRRKRD